MHLLCAHNLVGFFVCGILFMLCKCIIKTSSGTRKIDVADANDVFIYTISYEAFSIFTANFFQWRKRFFLFLLIKRVIITIIIFFYSDVRWNQSSWCEMRGAIGAALLLILYIVRGRHIWLHIYVYWEHMSDIRLPSFAYNISIQISVLAFAAHMKLQSAYYFWSGSIFLRVRARARGNVSFIRWILFVCVWCVQS